MKKSILIAALAASLVLPGAVEALPYASKIRVASTSFGPPGTGTTISYVLNQAAATVTIEILNSSNAVVATFAGTATVGANSVVWNGKADNAAGANVGTGTGYRVRVTATGTEAAGWARYKANAATTSAPIAGDTDVFDDWFPKSVLVSTDPNSDSFGSAFAGVGYILATAATNQVAALVEFTADLELASPGADKGLTNRILRHPGDDGVLPSPGSYTVWGMSFDGTNQNRIYYAGQATTSNPGAAEYMFGDSTAGVFPATATSADPAPVSFTNGNAPRSITIQTVGAQKYGFVSRGNVIVEVVAIDGDGTFGTVVGNIIGATGWTNTNARYSKRVRFDSAGNIYWSSQRVATATGTENGKIYRWSPATLAAAIASPTTAPLTEANADWKITADFAGVNQRVADVAFNSAGDAYVLTAVTTSGVYNVGNISTASLTLNLSTLTPVILASALRSSNLNAGASEIVFDAVDNLIIVEGGSENIFAYSPGGASTKTFTAPPSQTFAITTSAGDWQQYK